MADATDGFNNLSRKRMFWTVRHCWPRLARFAFNCYCHEVRLVVRVPGHIAMILMSMEGVTQGDPLAMGMYGISLIPLIEHLCVVYPDMLQP